MKTSSRGRFPRAVLHPARWTAYAAAGTATALGGLSSAEATIHYSGILNEKITSNARRGVVSKTFRFDQPGNSFQLHVSVSSSGGVGDAGLVVRGVGEMSFGGFVDSLLRRQSYVSRLSFGQNISTAPLGFVRGGLALNDVNMAYGFNESLNFQWHVKGNGFIGFKFNSGQGTQYGWARVRTRKDNLNSMALVDYAWGDPGDVVKAGDTGRGETPIKSEGCLGLLALGGAGLVAWRRSRQGRLPEAA